MAPNCQHFWILGEKYGYFFTAFVSFSFYPPSQFGGDPPPPRPRAAEPFHARQCGWGSGGSVAGGRRSRLSFQCEVCVCVCGGGGLKRTCYREEKSI